MPRGTIVWYDERTCEARIEHLGRRYSAQTNDIESAARVVGVNVHFDVERIDGVERAVNVRLVPGLRTSVHQRRRGERTHARADQEGHPPMSGRRPRRVAQYERAPAHEIAEVWLRHVRARELDDAVATYAPDAVLHVGAMETAGPDAIRRALISCPLFGNNASPMGMEDEGDVVVIGWAGTDGAVSGLTRLRMRHGEIAEQWLPAEASA